MNLNRVELIGFLGSEPETTYTPSGKAVATLSLATKTSWTKDDERQERTEWHRIQAWAKLAEYAAGFKKGAHLRDRRRIAQPRIRNRLRRQGPRLRNRRLFDRELTYRSTDSNVGDRIGSGYGPCRRVVS